MAAMPIYEKKTFKRLLLQNHMDLLSQKANFWQDY